MDLSHLELQHDDLAPLKYHPALTDMVPLIDTMLARGIKLKLEAVVLAS